MGHKYKQKDICEKVSTEMGMVVKEAQKRIEFDKGRYWTKKMNGSENKTKDENDDWQGNERCENK